MFLCPGGSSLIEHKNIIKVTKNFWIQHIFREKKMKTYFLVQNTYKEY